jgi:hypothetical protein
MGSSAPGVLSVWALGSALRLKAHCQAVPHWQVRSGQVRTPRRPGSAHTIIHKIVKS